MEYTVVGENRQCNLCDRLISGSRWNSHVGSKKCEAGAKKKQKEASVSEEQKLQDKLKVKCESCKVELFAKNFAAHCESATHKKKLERAQASALGKQQIPCPKCGSLYQANRMTSHIDKETCKMNILKAKAVAEAAAAVEAEVEKKQEE